MPSGSEEGQSEPFRIETGVPPEAPVVLDKFHEDGKVAVNLKYFQKRCECFSDWQKIELKAFSAWVEKISERTQAQITATTKTCHHHKPGKRASRFILPTSISPDIGLYSLDVGGKARVHGFFMEGNFFLLWLDRKHECFK